MSFFRSETMAYYQIIVPKESAWNVFNEMGKLSMVQVVDMSPDEPHVNRPFYQYIRRADEVISKLNVFEVEMLKYKIKNLKCSDYQQFLEKMSQYTKDINQSEDKWFDLIESTLDEKYSQLIEQIQNLEQICVRKNTLFEHKAVLIKSKEVLGPTYYTKGRNVAINPQIGGVPDQQKVVQPLYNLNYLVGVVDRLEANRFKRMVFRASKGNAWIVLSDIEYSRIDASLESVNLDSDKSAAKNLEKQRTVFLIVYTGGGQDFLRAKLNKICDSFNCAKFVLPDDPQLLVQKTLELDLSLDECDNLLRLTTVKIKELLLEYAQIQPQLKISLLEMSKLLMVKEKALYTNLNYLYQKERIYIGFFWAPKHVEGELHHMLHQLSVSQSNTSVGQIIELEPPEKVLTPTYFKINEFNYVFQEIVNTYGIPRYKEINPGMFAVMFFPFMFGIMFGDIGHGGVLFILAFLLVKNSDTLRKLPDFAGLIQVRYLFLLMGICALYCGIIYNDFMSLTWNIFGSCFENVPDSEETVYIKGCTYPIGFDPKWYIASNELNFFNSFKMKFAIIYGVSQMIFGILLKGVNNIYFKDYLSFVFEFLPQLIFMCITFGYMAIMIMLKWGQSWEDRTDKAPSIINSMINIPLQGGSTEGKPLFDLESQESLQQSILFWSFLCIPWMLIPKPIIEVFQHYSGKKHGKKPSKALEPKDESKEALLPMQQGQKSINQSALAEELRLQLIQKEKEKELKRKQLEEQRLKEQAGEDIQPKDQPQQILPKQQEQSGGHGHGHEEFDIGELAVHQIIETIEFVLGSISNTASYLRLWALSLAHGQLAKVFFEKCIGAGIVDGNVIVLVIGWPIFLHCTIGVLMCMDLMECFLHALRLQWVEFQSKFYKADGIKFMPFSFKEVLTNQPKDQ
ncbi:unnamed protein product [Paramecium pentaurelia]|uniref:V-type proton ATPase subunit a n=1 Tax=Paramecium pentaurelia TaxID=43138 RepID=A0A8S1TV82_9CILI|nr:unnamed protein product [Paramecium pentaurelia]